MLIFKMASSVNADASARVVLVHGLWMNGAAMLPLGWQLARCGFDVVRFSYASVGDGLEHNADRLARLCRKQETEPLHLVGHSLGGLLILAALEKNKDLKVQRVVLIGSPYAGITAAVGLARSAIGEKLLGRTLNDWMRMPRPSIPNGVELGVIAGDVPFGLGRVVARLPKPNDGVARVDETRVPGAKESIVLRINHTGMLVSPAVARAACAFLHNGTFRHA
jgi:pimeloyl-ACP methyl ester carboxylesterase